LDWNADVRKLVLRYLLLKTEAVLRPKFNPKETSSLTWNDEPIKYIAADSVFVAFSSKTDDDDLLAELLAALNAWRPSPHVCSSPNCVPRWTNSASWLSDTCSKVVTRSLPGLGGFSSRKEQRVGGLLPRA